jgi:hypothetical protein
VLKTVLLVTGGIDEAPPGSKKAAGSAQGGKARTVNWCEQANALIDRIPGGWSATRSEDSIPLSL